MKVRFKLSIGFPSAVRSEIMEYPDNVTDEELDEDWLEWAHSYINGGPTRLEEQ